MSREGCALTWSHVRDGRGGGRWPTPPPSPNGDIGHHRYQTAISAATVTKREPVIALAMRRFEQFQSLRREAADLRQALEDRKIIERAKGILMKKAHLEEHDAFRWLQRLASDKNLKLVDLARMIITAEEAFQPPGV
jgi:hypothetical protein